MTSETLIASLPDRGIASVTGADAAKFLQGLLTNDVEGLHDGEAAHAALLSPQGKILFELFALRTGAAFLLESAAERIGDLVKRLSVYKLRAAVEIRDATSDFGVAALWGEGSAPAASPGVHVFRDPRTPQMGWRLIAEKAAMADIAGRLGAQPAPSVSYHAHRIAQGVPEGARDYVFGDAFPHEALFDRLKGVSFTKGCYVGQEIVSRMEHRGTARKRVVPVRALSGTLSSGSTVLAGEVEIGTIGSVADTAHGGRHGLALVRLDRVAEAHQKSVPLTANGAPLAIEVPEWAAASLSLTR